MRPSLAYYHKVEIFPSYGPAGVGSQINPGTETIQRHSVIFNCPFRAGSVKITTRSMLECARGAPLEGFTAARMRVMAPPLLDPSGSVVCGAPTYRGTLYTPVVAPGHTVDSYASEEEVTIVFNDLNGRTIAGQTDIPIVIFAQGVQPDSVPAFEPLFMRALYVTMMFEFRQQAGVNV